MNRKRILPSWLLWLALATGAVLGLLAGSKPTPSIEDQAKKAWNERFL